MRRFFVLATLGTMLCVSVAPAGDSPVALRVGRVHTALGAPIENGIVLVADGKIAAVGQGVAIPDGADVIELDNAVATPGLVEACLILDTELRQGSQNWTSGAPDRSFFRRAAEYQQAADYVATLNPHVCGPDCGGLPGNPRHGDVGHNCCGQCAGPRAANTNFGLAVGVASDAVACEQSSEVVPHLRMLDAIALESNDFKRLLRGGVTTVYVAPDSVNVIGPRGTILKTAGPREKRVVQPEAAVKVSFGSDPSERGQSNFLPPVYGPPPSFLTRRPNTRMGVDFVFRKAFYDARRYADGLPILGADAPPAAAIPVLQEMLAGKVPIRVQARMQHDIFTALRLTRELGLSFILEEATEAYRCLPQLHESKTPVIFGPLYMTPFGYRASTPEVRRARLNTPQQLADAGIVFALTAQEMRDEDGLVRQAALAVRYGLSRAAALRAITATPASLMGLAGRVGVLTTGAAADVVVWSGDPLDATSRVVLVLIDGQVVLDERR
jgi:imidazolonepropionase-like amidohydrolase